MRPDSEWDIETTFLDTSTNQLHSKSLPVGVWPLLRIGRYYIDGEVTSYTGRGEIGTVRISDTSEGEICEAWPSLRALYYFYKSPWLGAQFLWSFAADGKRYYVPCLELLRCFFIHNKMMAHALLKPYGLDKLYKQQALGNHDELLIDFADEVPVTLVNHKMVSHFAWAAVQPDARAAWGSVYDQIYKHYPSGEPLKRLFLRFRPPPLINSTWTYRGLEKENEVLILELYQCTGLISPCRSLVYRHSKLKKAVKVDTPRKPSGTGRGPSLDIGELDQSDDNVGTDGHQSVIPAPVSGLSFSNEISVGRDYSDERQVNTGDPISEGDPSAGTVSDRENEAVSAYESGGYGGKKPVEFDSLEMSEGEYIGDLRLFIEAMKRLDREHSEISVSMSLVLLPVGRAFSVSHDSRRVCVVASVDADGCDGAIFLEVDRSGGKELSTLMMVPKKPVSAKRLEEAIAVMLRALIVNSGHWRKKSLARLEGDFHIARLSHYRFSVKADLVAEETEEELIDQWIDRIYSKLEKQTLIFHA